MHWDEELSSYGFLRCRREAIPQVLMRAALSKSLVDAGMDVRMTVCGGPCFATFYQEYARTGRIGEKVCSFTRARMWA